MREDANRSLPDNAQYFDSESNSEEQLAESELTNGVTYTTTEMTSKSGLTEAEQRTKEQFGFLVRTDNPFVIFRKLQELATTEFSGKILDLSRGNPGLGFAPSEKHRKLNGFLSILDTVLNSNYSHYRIHEAKPEDTQTVMSMIESCAYDNFQPEKAQEMLEMLYEVLDKTIEAAAEEGLNWTELDVLKGIFNYSTITGGTYHATAGEHISRVVVADLYRDLLADPSINSREIIFTLGVNDGIGTVFKMLGKEGMGYLDKGDFVAVSSPAYSPYFSEIIARGLVPVEVRTDPDTGEVDLSQLYAVEGRIKAFFVINPNNPTGLPYERSVVEEIAQIAEAHDSLIVTDEIYAQFHENFASVWPAAKNRTIMLSGRSKIERGPGLRFGDVLISDDTNEYLTQFFQDSLGEDDFRAKFIKMKAPGSTYGSFHHTASVPGPSQMLGTLGILLGEEERAYYLELVDQNMEVFHDELNISRKGASYYSLFDLNKIPGATKQELTIEQKLCELASRGVILVPALKFFSALAQSESDKSGYVRAALPNVTTEDALEAARRIREYIQGE